MLPFHLTTAYMWSSLIIRHEHDAAPTRLRKNPVTQISMFLKNSMFFFFLKRSAVMTRVTGEYFFREEPEGEGRKRINSHSGSSSTYKYDENLSRT